MSDNPPDGTQHVPDGPAPATETQFVPDGPAPEKPVAATPARFVDKPVPASPARPADTPVELPRFGRFRALAEIGSGAMGTVFRAYDDVLGRPVAIKSLRATEHGTRERFLREARAIGAVLHPNILAVYDAGTEQETPYLVMELAAGGSLRERIRAGALPIETVRRLGIQIARALAAAHAANILHRDVKPANILAASGHGSVRTEQRVDADGDVWKLADFGIARLPDSTLTIEGQFLGSPSYAAPEALRAGQFSPASDVYSLGATLYEALAGVPPHGDHDMQSVVRKLEQDAPSVQSRRSVPASLDAAVMATLARDPAKRPSAEELARLLAQTDDAWTGSARPESARTESTRTESARTEPARTESARTEAAPLPRPPSTGTKALALALAAVAIVLVAIALSRDKRGPAPSMKPVFDPREQVAKPRPNAPPRARDEASDERDRATDGEHEHENEREHEDDSALRDREPAGAPEPPGPPLDPAQPQIVDQYGNPVDDETARQILEQMERDARDELGGMGRKKGKHKKRP